DPGGMMARVSGPAADCRRLCAAARTFCLVVAGRNERRGALRSGRNGPMLPDGARNMHGGEIFRPGLIGRCEKSRGYGITSKSAKRSLPELNYIFYPEN